MHLKNDDYDKKAFLSVIFSDLIEHIFKNEQYEKIRSISKYFTDDQILNSTCAFECAYSYGEIDDNRSAQIYEKIIEKEPRNSSAINNLGVQYEHRHELFKAMECYEKAFSISHTELHQQNLKRIHECIIEQTDEEISFISDSISLESLNELGYTTDLCQKIFSIQEEKLKKIILRDLRECAIAVVAGQDKMATIMCGSIIETLLMQKLKEQGVVKYDISEMSNKKNAKKYPLDDMGLNELLFVSEKENVIVKNSYYLGHYIRDYRNVVHPAKEIRMKEEVNHDNVLTMWSVLKRLINDIL